MKEVQEQENGRPGREKDMPLVKQPRTLCVCVFVFDHSLIGLRSAPGRVNRDVMHLLRGPCQVFVRGSVRATDPPCLPFCGASTFLSIASLA